MYTYNMHVALSAMTWHASQTLKLAAMSKACVRPKFVKQDLKGRHAKIIAGAE